jgi:hypothetical protein
LNSRREENKVDCSCCDRAFQKGFWLGLILATIIMSIAAAH